MALGDVTGDGRPDIVTANDASSTVGVIAGRVGGTFAAAVTYTCGGSNPFGVAVGDMNGDGRLDIVTANSGSNTVGVLLNTTGLATAAARDPGDAALYPNPARGSFAVLLPGVGPATAVRAELVNALGQVVREQQNLGGHLTVPTVGLAAGIYTLRLQAAADAWAKRVVVE